MLEDLAEGIWTEEAPQQFMRLEMGARMTVVRLSGGGLLLYAAIAATEERRAAIAELGPVEVVVCPNRFHHLHAGGWIEAYSDARLWAPPGLAKKRPDLRIDLVLGKDQPAWAAECEPIPVHGAPGMQENVLWHGATRTLIASDLFQNYERAARGLWTGTYFTLMGISGGPAVSRVIRFAYRDRAAARQSIDRMIALKPERIVVSHGQIVRQDATATLQGAFAWLKR